MKDLRDQKGKRVLVETLPFSPEEAAAAEEAGIDTMKARFDPRQPDLTAAIRRAAPNTFMAFSVPLVAAASEVEAVRIGYDAMALGADAIMCQWSPRFVAAAADAGIPIQGHAGLVPRKSTWTGGLRAVGKTLDEAMWVYREIKALEGRRRLRGGSRGHPRAGCWSRSASARGCLRRPSERGSGGDIQFLFADDILGNNPPPYPRHSKQYRHLYKMKEAMQAEAAGRIPGIRRRCARGGVSPDRSTSSTPRTTSSTPLWTRWNPPVDQPPITQETIR